MAVCDEILYSNPLIFTANNPVEGVKILVSMESKSF